MSLAPSAPTASHLLHERDDDAAPRLVRSASLEGSTSVNPKDYQWGQLTSSSQQQLFGQFMASSMQSLMLALQFPMHGGGFASWMLHAGGASNNAQRLPAAPAPPTFVGACCAPGPVAQGGPPAAPAAALLLSPAAAAPHSTASLETKKNAQLAATTTCSNTKRKQGPPSALPSSKISKIAKATARAPTVPPAPPPAAAPTTFYKVEQQQYAAEPLGLELDDICKLFDTTTTKEEHMGDCYTTGAGLSICPTSAPLCLDPPPYSFDQDFCLDGLLDIESVMAEMSSQCCDTTAAASPEAFPPPPPAPAPARSSTRAAARPKARKAKGSSSAKAAACFPAPQLAPALQAAS